MSGLAAAHQRAEELVSACAVEATALAERAEGPQRKRLLVLAHTLAVTRRELALGARAGTLPVDPELAVAIRSGEHDGRLGALIDALRERVRRELEVVKPGYDNAEPNGGVT